MILLATDNQFGAVSGILLLGGAFAPIYPLLVEKIGHRFPSFHPGFYNGIFSFAIAGGLLAPARWVLRVAVGRGRGDGTAAGGLGGRVCCCCC